MPNNPRTTLIVLSAVAAGLLLLGQFVNWFQTSGSIPSGGAGTFTFEGGSFTFGFTPWAVSGSSSFGGGSESWMSGLGDEGSTWQTTLMAFAGPLMLVATVLAAVAILPMTQGRLGLSARLSIIGAVCAGVAVLSGFLFNYTQEGTYDIFFGVFIAIAGAVMAVVAGVMTRNAMAGNVPGPTTPTTRPTTRPPVQ